MKSFRYFVITKSIPIRIRHWCAQMKMHERKTSLVPTYRYKHKLILRVHNFHWIWWMPEHIRFYWNEQPSESVLSFISSSTKSCIKRVWHVEFRRMYFYLSGWLAGQRNNGTIVWRGTWQTENHHKWMEIFMSKCQISRHSSYYGDSFSSLHNRA